MNAFDNDLVRRFFFVLSRNKGYAIAEGEKTDGVHCIIAAPWEEKPVSPEVLIETLRGFLNGKLASRRPTIGTHGRLTWTITADAGTKYVVHVMPRITCEGLRDRRRHLRSKLKHPELVS